MLQTIMGHIYGADPGSVAECVLSELELECMSALDWRLGHFCFTIASFIDLFESPVQCWPESALVPL